MKALWLEMPAEAVADRRRKGLDRHDEVWEGVWHMVPPPAGEHQEIVDDLFVLFRTYAQAHGLGRLRTNAGVRDVRSAQEDYRIPEWVFVGHEREDLLHSEHGYVDDGPDLILEVRSPGDETDAKLPFYERVGTRECLIVDRDSRHVVLLRLIGERLLPTTPNVDGWLYSEALHAFFRTDERQGRPALRVRLELTGAEHFV